MNDQFNANADGSLNLGANLGADSAKPSVDGVKISTDSAKPKKVILCILDGWGLAKDDQYNAIKNARTPVFDFLVDRYGMCVLPTDGEYVGLPAGQVGTSETNHLVIGSGMVPRQMLLQIDQEIRDGSFFENQVLLETFAHAEHNLGALHLVGLVSDGGVHSHINHLFAIFQALARQSFSRPIFIHVYTDGRDTLPQSASSYLEKLEKEIANYPDLNIKIASLQGRFYLDRDRDWQKTQQSCDLLLHARGQKIKNWRQALELSYANMSGSALNDQYHPHFIFDDYQSIKANDACLVFNFRADRCLQLLTQLEKDLDRSVYLSSFCKPSESLELEAIFTADKITTCLARVLADAGKSQLHLSETEKYPHVTYYFNAKSEKTLIGEDWQVFESNRQIKPHYNKEPEMRAKQITDFLLNSIDQDKYDFYIVNYPNTDMVGHTGDYQASVQAAEYVDLCLGKIYEKIKSRSDEYALLITADHGNSDIMWDYQANQPHTAHTHSPVPLVLIEESSAKKSFTKENSSNTYIQKTLVDNGYLHDIAPTVLDLMQIIPPTDMTGQSLRRGVE